MSGVRDLVPLDLSVAETGATHEGSSILCGGE